MNSERGSRRPPTGAYEGEDEEDEDWDSMHSNDPKKMSFIQKVFEMVNSSEFDRCIRWSESGETFIIPDVEELERSVLPQYFKSSNVSSFVRQLNFYGFRKLTKTRDPKQTWEFQHPYFTRNSSQDELTAIKRKTALNTDPARAELEMYREQLASLRKQNEQLKQENAEKDETIKQLRTKVSKCEGDIEELRKQVHQTAMAQQLASAAGQGHGDGTPYNPGPAGSQPYSSVSRPAVNSAFNQPYPESGRSDSRRIADNSANTSFRMSTHSDRSGSMSQDLWYPPRLQRETSAGASRFGSDGRIFSDGSDVSFGDRSLSSESQGYSLFPGHPQTLPQGSTVGMPVSSPPSNSVAPLGETPANTSNGPNGGALDNEIVCTSQNMCLRKGDIYRVQNYIAYAPEIELQGVVQTLLDNIVQRLVNEGSLEMSTMYENQATRQLTPKAKMRVAEFISNGTGQGHFNQAAAEIAVIPNSGVSHNIQNHPGKAILMQLLEHFSTEVVFSCILPIPRVQRCLVRLFNISEKVLQDMCGSKQGNPQLAIQCLIGVLSNQIGYGQI
eukprot:gb/GECG01007545.1/.p1 GENE.gb/GECG01007545.1/~~gb/GECG01007545.1/.p1  ORF type:complete len:556 (+),score=67.06 gb/GECG01007545.1/:1-1668(+)